MTRRERRPVIVGVCLSAMLLGFVLGAYSGPPRVVSVTNLIANPLSSVTPTVLRR